MFPKCKYILVIDLEATCNDSGSFPRTQMEIIEIGAVMVDRNSLQPVTEFQTFIKPVQNPQLTPFCSKLTSITQAMVENAPTYPNAIDSLKLWLENYPDYLFTSWGNYDRNQFEQDCMYHRLEYPFTPSHVNLKAKFSENQNLRKRFGMKKALQLVGISLEGCHHRGIDDARNIARLLPWVLGRQKLNDR